VDGVVVVDVEPVVVGDADASEGFVVKTKVADMLVEDKFVAFEIVVNMVVES
jgi:hypothetical protein